MPRTKKLKLEEPTEKKDEITPRSKKEKVFIATGRRKSSIAKVFLYPKKGDFLVNGVPLDEYFTSEECKTQWLRPFHIVGVSHPASTYSASVKVMGSGKSSQFDAMVLGFSRALVIASPEFRPILRKQGLLTRDSREVERKKYFLRKARKRPQYSKR